MNTFEENAGRIARSMGAAARQVAEPVPVLVGEVVSADPLKLRLNGMDLEGAALRVNPELLAGYDPRLGGSLSGSGPMGTVTTPVNPGELTRRECALRPGDQVAAFTLDRQTYYILCKVVRP